MIHGTRPSTHARQQARVADGSSARPRLAAERVGNAPVGSVGLAVEQ
jgi:hypothetical protein